jgi:hypothetical protein
LLLSAIWIGASVYAANPLTYPWLWKAPQYEIAFVTGNKIVLDTSKSHDELVATLTVAMKKEAVDLKERDEILAGINSSEASPQTDEACDRVAPVAGS